MQAQAAAEGRACVVGAIVVDGAGRAFVMRRSANRRLFPECWDIPGGHVEEGETLAEALAREIHEETGWQLRQIIDLLDTADWQSEVNGQPHLRREFDFLVEVEGDLSAPRIEVGKFSEYRWIGLDDLAILAEHREPDDRLIQRLVQMGLTGGLSHSRPKGSPTAC
jgi:8-oxo-dGTP pyrophosphatase MutT (NUDIX family)